MIGYGAAFVIGWLFFTVCRAYNSKDAYPWSLGGPIWGLVFMGLNWVATL